jgi:hypothetical protein
LFVGHQVLFQDTNLLIKAVLVTQTRQASKVDGTVKPTFGSSTLEIPYKFGHWKKTARVINLETASKFRHFQKLLLLST